MSKIVLDDVISGYGLSKINENFQKVQDELNNKVLYRDNPDGEPNTIEQDVDVNGFSLYNVDKINGVNVDTLTDSVDIVVANMVDINTVADNIDNVNIVAGINEDVTDVAAVATDVSILAPYVPDIAGYATGIYESFASSDAGKGAELVEYQNSTVETALDTRLPEIGNYAALRVYTGPVTAYYVRSVANIFDGGAGVFRVDAADATTADNGGTVLVDASGRRWKREFSGDINVKWFGVADGATDDTEALRKCHAVANGAGLPVSYAGVASMVVQANADIQINTDTDFAGCEFVLLNGMDPDPDYSTHNVLFRVRDDATPYELTGITKANCVLTKGARVPFGVQQPGYYLLSCDYLISNRDKTGTTNYAQSFRIDEEGVAQFGLSADVSTCTAVTVRRRLNPGKRLKIGGARFRPGDFTNQILFCIERNDVHAAGFWFANYAAVPAVEDICALFRIDNAADVSIEDVRGPGRVVVPVGGLSQGTYVINPEGAANLTLRNVHASSYGSVLASNNVNGMWVEGSILNRVDVHSSGHNVFVRDSVLLNRGIGIGWGGGTISAHRVTVYDAPIVTDREDYGGSWFGGHIDVQDCEMAGSYWRNWFAVELCAFRRVTTGAGVGSTVETFMPDSITVENVVRKAPVTAGGNHVIGGVRMYTNKARADLGKVYAPKHVLVRNIRAEGHGANNYRFGNYLALREMWPNASGDVAITIADCPSYAVAMTAFNLTGKTLHTGESTAASANAPTQSQSARGKIKITNCELVAVECTITGGEIDITAGTVQRVKCVSTDATQRQSVRYHGVRFYGPILEGAETIGQACGYNQNAYFPTTVADSVVLDAFDFGAASSLQGVITRAGVTPTWPSGATAASAFTGWKHASLWA